MQNSGLHRLVKENFEKVVPFSSSTGIVLLIANQLSFMIPKVVFPVLLENAEIRQHLTLLTKHVPEWASFQTVRTQEFFKISKDSDLSKVVSKLQELAQTKDKSM
ncbi:hypothetical protein M8J77_025395 [Diaphorina citri]|nr:hypothetical protein M8J77_025395 [Diaphorina citri]